MSNNTLFLEIITQEIRFSVANFREFIKFINCRFFLKYEF